MIWNGRIWAGLVAGMVALASSSDVFTAIFADYAKLHGAGFAPVWGPSGVLRERLQNGEAFDVFASAALPHAQALTDTGMSGSERHVYPQRIVRVGWAKAAIWSRRCCGRISK